MNKTFKQTMIAGLACLAFCGTTFAYPPTEGRCNAGAMRGAPAHQTAKPGHNGGRHAPEPAHHAAPVAHHAPAPCHPAPPPPPPPPPPPHHDGHCEGTGLVALGATVVGGIVGGIVGACL